jgi:hypothetical protein
LRLKRVPGQNLYRQRHVLHTLGTLLRGDDDVGSAAVLRRALLTKRGRRGSGIVRLRRG